MLTIDMTTELAPLLGGLNALLALSALAVFAPLAGRAVRNWLRTLPRPRVTAHRPALGHSR